MTHTYADFGRGLVRSHVGSALITAQNGYERGQMEEQDQNKRVTTVQSRSGGGGGDGRAVERECNSARGQASQREERRIYTMQLGSPPPQQTCQSPSRQTPPRIFARTEASQLLHSPKYMRGDAEAFYCVRGSNEGDIDLFGLPVDLPVRKPHICAI